MKISLAIIISAITIIIGLILLGRYFEARAKSGTSEAIKKLTDLLQLGLHLYYTLFAKVSNAFTADFTYTLSLV